MHIITKCPDCGKDFMYHQLDDYLFRPVAYNENGEAVSFEVICQECAEFPIKDDIWPSRRWNKQHTDYIDL